MCVFVTCMLLLLEPFSGAKIHFFICVTRGPEKGYRVWASKMNERATSPQNITERERERERESQSYSVQCVFHLNQSSTFQAK